MVKIFKVLVIILAVIITYNYFRDEIRDMKFHLAMDRTERELIKKGIYTSMRGSHAPHIKDTIIENINKPDTIKKND